jgi:hypothetical protein
MDEDFTDFHKDFEGQSIFLPSMHVSYVNGISKEIGDIRSNFSPTTLHSMQMLNFFNEKHGLFYYPWALYSAGVANLDLNRASEAECAIYDRDRSKSFLMVDSGGFQIVTNALAMDWANPDETRMKILRWQEAVGDVATVLDVPTFATQKDTPFTTFQQCLDQTNDNLRFIDDNRTGEVPFLNVLQGDTNTEIEDWYNGVNWFPAHGWAFAGGTKLNLYNFLRTVIMLRDRAELEGDKGVCLHILGVGKPVVGAILTIVQNAIREYINPNTQITLDASNPFQQAGLRGNVNLHYTFSDTKKPTRAVVENFESLLPYSDPTKPLRDAFGPVLNDIPVSDMFVQNDNGEWRDRERDGKGPSDAISYCAMMAHNTYMLLDEFLTNNLMLAGDPRFSTQTAINFERFKKIINRVFTKDAPRELHKNRTTLEEFIIWEPR